jgi:hypothetical protein
MLFSYAVNAWIHIHFLPRVQLTEKIDSDMRVVPSQIISWIQGHKSLSILYASILILSKVFQLPA